MHRSFRSIAASETNLGHRHETLVQQSGMVSLFKRYDLLEAKALVLNRVATYQHSISILQNDIPHIVHCRLPIANANHNKRRYSYLPCSLINTALPS